MPQGQIVGVLATFSHQKNGSAYLLRTGRHVIGSAGTANIKVKDPKVSAKHAVVYAKPGLVVIEDCRSALGTFVKGKPVTEKTRLTSGDVVQTGDTLWRFVLIETPDPGLKR
jgi:pSer/pThr/pTyr-binding forkhead associated (FHA) protein